jgi:hypothetical protein
MEKEGRERSKAYWGGEAAGGRDLCGDWSAWGQGERHNGGQAPCIEHRRPVRLCRERRGRALVDAERALQYARRCRR